ncbi:hypothetical protein POSPLADRAFT_1074311 [Postia placenta MAD-698-R-SB12]|uniref:F-box domain-containing protein n=1 Tax=Postia placenta MAD-698-R-SB12 TaxID=670580 RepID=A0A1X6N2X0_9APHY|nr:hypothetical protein POSPLADRAFT_1074311 [Postia placenta MAD-698-R-SB12]OSX62977.1 hypothetical protein POSPLADRAFT_1074311 [Postia placenta MAD-698-R-SB12]
MSFFRSRRRVQQDADNTSMRSSIVMPGPPSRTPTLNGDSASLLSKLGTPRAGKRLQTFSLLSAKFSPLGKRPKSSSGLSMAAPVGHTVDFPRTFSRESTPSPTPSLEEIRMPLGLGRPASMMGDAEDAPQTPRTPTRERRRRSISLPNRVGSEQKQLGAKLGSTAEDSPVITRIPSELWQVVFSFASRSDVLALSRVSKAFLIPALRVLYRKIDMRIISPDHVEQCMSLFASKRSVATCVHEFASGTLPSSKDSAPSFGIVTYAIAFNNMDRLQSLVIPWFDAHIFRHTTFRLKSLTLLSQSISADEYRALMSWLADQTALVDISFPDLHLDKPYDLDIGASEQSSQTELPDTPTQSTTTRRLWPAHLLPHLISFHGPASMAAVVVPGRPVSTAVIHVHSTLWEGLKPSAVMSGLTQSSACLTHLTIKSTSTHVDARTLERLFMSAGSELGGQLEVLDIEWVLGDEVLYKQVLPMMPRHRTLHVLRMYRTGLLPLSSSESPMEDLPTPPLTATNIPPPSALPTPLPSPFPISRPGSAASGSGSQPPRAREEAYLSSWGKHCSSLREVVFLSGARWRRERISAFLMPGEHLPAPTFRFVGLTSCRD